ncbi:hypothetical protein [Pseudomonas sp. Gutcm_11s]|uniref:hypothetical protein n=1 Tax=Pseudomonas sp. Gutcm_11s TaxID=3026088 RepID=UPI002362C8AE|nr:hypothetical protein [Pseudomonas sp. Gutcm_11s]MDD0841420.1 hypothetical protein [Pseudomonas sp. Gutcm_11s]
MRLVVLLFSLLLLAGCETMKILTTPKIEPSAPKTDVGILQLIGATQGRYPIWVTESQDKKQILVDPEVAAVCAPPSGIAAASAAIWAPIAARVVIDAAGKAAANYVKKVKAQSSKSTAFRSVVSGKDLREAKCLIAYRGPSIDLHADGSGIAPTSKVADGNEIRPEPKPSALVLMRVEHQLNTLRLVPIYAMAKNSVSLTKCTGDCSLLGRENGKISISVAVTGTAVVKPSGNDIKLRDIGTATLTVKDIPLGGKVVSVPKKGAVPLPVGDRSAILAIPNDDVAIQLSIGMTEAGDVAGDPDIADSEILAATAAFSEGALAEIKAHYDRAAAD